MSFAALIDHVSAAIGRPPRRFSLAARWRNRLPRPLWMRDGDGLLEVIRRQQEVYREGRVVWGLLVQANAELFDRGRADLPAAVIYSFDLLMHEYPNWLQEIGERVQALKGAAGVAEATREAASFLEGHARTPRLQLPPQLTGLHEAFIGAILVRRRHLPGCRISAPLVPLLAHDSVPQVIIVPHWYWPEPLLAVWRGETVEV